MLTAGSVPHPAPLSLAELRQSLSPFDTRRLHSYSNNLVDYHVIVDLVPTRALLLSFFASEGYTSSFFLISSMLLLLLLLVSSGQTVVCGED